MLGVWGAADIGHPQPECRSPTDRFPIAQTGCLDTLRSLAPASLTS